MLTLRALLDDSIDRLTLCDRDDLVQVRAMLARLEAQREATAVALARSCTPSTLGPTFASEELEGVDTHDTDQPTGWHSGRYDFEGDVAIDFAPDHCDSYEHNLGHRPISMDVRDVDRPPNTHEPHSERACHCEVTPCPCACHRLDLAGAT